MKFHQIRWWICPAYGALSAEMPDKLGSGAEKIRQAGVCRWICATDIVGGNARQVGVCRWECSTGGGTTLGLSGENGRQWLKFFKDFL